MLIVISLRRLNARRRQPNDILGTHPPLVIHPIWALPTRDLRFCYHSCLTTCTIGYYRFFSTAPRIIKCFVVILLLRLFLVFLYRVVLSYCYHIYIFFYICYIIILYFFFFLYITSNTINVLSIYPIYLYLIKTY